MSVIIKGLGKGERVKILACSPHWVEALVLTGKFSGKVWTFNPDEIGP